MQPVDALTEAERSAADTTPAAEAAHWLQHPAAESVAPSQADLWDAEPEWTPPEDTACQA